MPFFSINSSGLNLSLNSRQVWKGWKFEWKFFQSCNLQAGVIIILMECTRVTWNSAIYYLQPSSWHVDNLSDLQKNVENWKDSDRYMFRDNSPIHTKYLLSE